MSTLFALLFPLASASDIAAASAELGHGVSQVAAG